MNSITKNFTRKELFAFLFSIASALLGTTIVLFLQFFLASQLKIWDQYLLFFPAIALLTRFVGLGGGIATSILSSCVIAYFLITPEKLSESPLLLIELIIFTISGILISYLVDSTTRMRNVNEYVAREREYQQENLKLQRELDTANEEVKARDEFLSIASHELKTPLTSMLLQLQTVLHSIRNVSLANFSVENLLKMLDSAEHQSIRLSKMINDLLNVSLITTGRMELEKDTMDLSETVKNVVDQYSEKAKRDNITIHLQLEKNVKGVWDSLRIEQVITNLLSNALKYGNKKPIEIRVHKREGSALLIVKDQGIGIPKNLHEKVFARFERAVEKNSYDGLGVGLYITRQIVTAHKGRVTVESDNGRGTEFRVELPLEV